MGSFETIGPKGEVKASLASLQWPRRPSKFGVLRKCCSKTSSGHYKSHIRCPRENRILSLQDNVSILLFGKVKINVPLVLSFSDADKLRTIQPHDDALVVTLRIGGYNVKRVMINQGSAAKIMYPDLYKGLGLKPENLTTYSSPLVSFEGKMVVPKGQIRLLVQVGTDVVEVDFIVVDVFSPYTAIISKPWLHTLGTFSSTFHQKVKYPSGDQVLEIVGSQSVARQCLVAAIQHKPEVDTSATTENDL